MEVSGAALIRQRAVLVDLGGQTYRIAARPAGDWMLALLDGGLADVVPGMLEGDLDALYEALDSGEVSSAECEAAAQDAVSAAAGCPWWVAYRLIASAASDAAAMGELRLSGADPGVIPLGAALVSLYRIYTRDRDRKETAKFEMDLLKLPPGVSAVDARYDEAAAAQQFDLMFAARGGH